MLMVDQNLNEVLVLLSVHYELEKLMPLLTKLAARKITKEQFEALGSAYSEDEDQAPKVIKRSLEEIQDLKDTNDLIKVRSSQ